MPAGAAADDRERLIRLKPGLLRLSRAPAIALRTYTLSGLFFQTAIRESRLQPVWMPAGAVADDRERLIRLMNVEF